MWNQAAMVGCHEIRGRRVMNLGQMAEVEVQEEGSEKLV